MVGHAKARWPALRLTLRLTLPLGLALALGLGSGCYSPTFQEGVACDPDGNCPSGQSCFDGVCRSPSLVPDASEEPACAFPDALMFEPRNFDVCDIPEDPPTLELTEATTVLDTDAATLGDEPIGVVVEQGDGSEALLVAARSIHITEGNFLSVEGSRPAILVSLGDVDIDGFLIASASLATGGPGSNPAACGGGDPGVAEVGAITGGGGGGFAGTGGTGSSGEASDVTAGGAPNGEATVSPLRGGCPGGTGGGALGGVGGGGGGALQISAAGTVRIGPLGVINAGGGGGGGGGTGPNTTGDAVVAADGGGGGGAGGAILVEAFLGISVEMDGSAGVLTAAGGGGGGGAYENISGGNGGNGGTDGPGTSGNPANSGSDEAGVGGSGGGLPPNLDGIAASPGVVVSEAARGGGGGGGAAGRIVLRSPNIDVAGTTFPTPVQETSF